MITEDLTEVQPSLTMNVTWDTGLSNLALTIIIIIIYSPVVNDGGPA
jgi:hypothetical protein